MHSISLTNHITYHIILNTQWQCKIVDKRREEAHTLTSHCAWIQNRSIASHRKSFEVILGLLKFNDSMEGESVRTVNRAEVGYRVDKERENDIASVPAAKLTSAH